MNLQTPCRVISIICMLYVFIAKLGETGSYMKAISAGCIYYVVWWLGLKSANAEGEVK